jgi:hypothetical protein
MVAALVAGLAIGSAAPAWADTVRIEATGEAAAEATGGTEARTRALDAAFAEAVTQALARLVDGSVQRQRGEDIARVTVRRARRFVRSYRVLDEGTRGQRMEVRIAAQVDLDGLRAALAEIGIEARGGESGGADGATPAPAAGKAGASGALVLMRVEVVGSTQASLGTGAIEALERQVSELGFGLRRASEAAGRRAGDGDALPFSDDAAAELGEEAQAACVLVVGLEVTPAVRVRGTRLHGAAGHGVIRVLDVRSGVAEVVAEAEVSGGGFADAPEAALERAASVLGQRLIGAVSPAMGAHFRPAVATEGALLVEIRGHTGWQQVSSIISQLARTSGIERVWPRRVGSGAVILAVDTDGDGERAQRRVASILERLTLPAAAISVERSRQGLALTIEVGESGRTDRETP